MSQINTFPLFALDLYGKKLWKLFSIHILTTLFLLKSVQDMSRKQFPLLFSTVYATYLGKEITEIVFWTPIHPF
jgi:hypothetical protein